MTTLMQKKNLTEAFLEKPSSQSSVFILLQMFRLLECIACDAYQPVGIVDDLLFKLFDLSQYIRKAAAFDKS